MSRVLLKLSGESFADQDTNFGIESNTNLKNKNMPRAETYPAHYFHFRLEMLNTGG